MDLGLEGGFHVAVECVNPKFHTCTINADDDRAYLPETCFKTVFANDILQYAESAWKPFFNRRGLNAEQVFHTESIVDLVKKHEAGEFCFPENIDIVTGGFPCQDFSVAVNATALNLIRPIRTRLGQKFRQKRVEEAFIYGCGE